MSTDQDQEVAQFRSMLDVVNRQTGFFIRKLESVGDVMEQHQGKYVLEMREYDKHLKNLSMFNKEGDKEHAAFARHAALQKLAHEQARAVVQEDLKAKKESIKAHEALRDQALQMMDTGKIRIHGQAIERETAERDAQMAAINNHTDQIGGFSEIIQEQEAQLRAWSWKVPLGKIGKSLQSGIARMFSTGMLVKGTMGTYNAITHGIATSVNIGMERAMKTGFKFGLDPLEYSKLIAQHRRSILAAGGLEKADAMLEEGHKQYRKEIGTSAETTRFTAEQMTLLTRAGIKPMIGDVGLLSDSFVKLKKTTGLVPAELMGAFSEIMDDESTIANLRAHSSEDERRAIVAGTARRLAENVAMGMTTEQAKAAAKQLNKLAGKGPLERFKDAAKLQAMGAAMGISGGARAAELMRKGRRMTEDEKGELQKYLSKMSNAIETSATSPNQGYEFMVDALATKLDIRPMLVDLNTTLAKPVAATEDAQKTLGEQYKVIKDHLPKLQDIVNAVTKNPVAQMGAGAIGTAVDIALGGANIWSAVKNAKSAAQMAQTATKAIPVARLMLQGAKAIPIVSLLAGVSATAVAGFVGTVLGTTAVAQSVYGMATGKGADNYLNDIIKATVGDASMMFESDTEKKVAQMMNAPVSGKGRAPTPITAKGQEEAHTATLTTATGIERQLTKMDESSAFLKKLSENSEMQIELAQKQLLAMTMTEDEKKENTLRSRLRTGNPYAEGYGRLA